MSARDLALVALIREIATEAALDALQRAQAPAPVPEAPLTTREAARRAGRRPEAIQAWISKGLLPATKPAGTRGWLIKVADLDAFLRGRGSTGTGSAPLNLEQHRSAAAAKLAASLKGNR